MKVLARSSVLARGRRQRAMCGQLLKRIGLFAGASVALTAASASAQGTTEWFQTCERNVITAGSVNCNNAGPPMTTMDNWYHRVFDRSNVQTTNQMPGACGPNPAPVSAFGGVNVTEFRVGVEAATTTAGLQTLHFTVFDNTGNGMTPQDPLTATVLGTFDYLLADTNLSLETIPVNPPIFIPASVTHVQLTVMSVAGVLQSGDVFFVGSNSDGEEPLDSSYISSPTCAVTIPVSFTSLGFLGIHVVLEMTTEDPRIGTSYCNPAVPNSAGLPGRIFATGSEWVLESGVTLTADRLPQAQPGYFLNSQVQGYVNPPGSNGFICLGGAIGRYNQSQNVIVGPTGSIQIDLTSVPQPSGLLAVLPGDTWNFQCWYRDLGSSNNFTNAVSVTFN